MPPTTFNSKRYISKDFWLVRNLAGAAAAFLLYFAVFGSLSEHLDRYFVIEYVDAAGIARTPSPLNVYQIHSGHSLTDALFQGSWPGLYINLIESIDPSAIIWNGSETNIIRSTIPGSTMDWRWDHSSGSSDAREDIADYAVLSITENNLIAPASLFPSGWQADMRAERRADFSRWVNHAREEGNNGAGAEVFLYTNWPDFADYAPSPNWRARLEANEVEWIANAQNAEALAPNGTHIFIIPGNALMMQLWDDAEAGLIPGIADGEAWRDSSRWWSDTVHPASLGGLALAYLHVAVIHHVDPRGLEYDSLGLSVTPSANEATYIQNLVWDLAVSYAWTGLVGEEEEEEEDEPTVTLGANPTTITVGNSTTLTWSTTDATSCTASNGWSGARATSGSTSVSPTTNTIYTLTCTGAGGSDAASVAVTVEAEEDEEGEEEEEEEDEEVEESSGGGGGGGGGSSKKTTSRNTTSVTASTANPSTGTAKPVAPVETTLPSGFTFTRNISSVTPASNTAADVRWLETFLNEFEGESLSVDGVYGPADSAAVKRFQSKYQREILDVWNLSEATGYVGLTTRLKMNFLLKGQTASCPVFVEYNGGLNGIKASPEIGRTQQVLRELELYSGPINNTWDAATNQALIRFQETFKEVMLIPWNLQRGTGYKYKTTNLFLNYFVGCDTGAVTLDGAGQFEL